jgi:hypothetical protein
MFRFTIRELVLLSLVVAMWVGWWMPPSSTCGDEPRFTADITDADRMIKAISAQAPAGTKIEEAKRFMEREGFTCEYKSSGWKDERGEYLYCHRADKHSALVARVWKVAVFHADGKVAKVDANTGLVGP